MNLSQSFTQSQSIPSSWLWIFISFWDIQVSGQVPRKASPHMLPFSQIATGKNTSGHLRASQSLSFSEFLQLGQWLRTQVVFFVFSHVFPCFAPLAPSALASLWAHSAASSATRPRSPGPWRRTAGVAPERRNAVGRRGRWSRHLGRQTEMFWDGPSGPSTISCFINHYHNPH